MFESNGRVRLTGELVHPLVRDGRPTRQAAYTARLRNRRYSAGCQWPTERGSALRLARERTRVRDCRATALPFRIMPVSSPPGRIEFRASCCPHVSLPDCQGSFVKDSGHMRLKLTDRFVKSATTCGRKSPIFMDDEVIGFGIHVRETGRKSFHVRLHVRGLAPPFSRLIDARRAQTDDPGLFDVD